MRRTDAAEVKCASCGYDVRGGGPRRCPECGAIGVRAPRPGAGVCGRVGFNPVQSTLGAIWLILHPHRAIGAEADLNRRFASTGCRLVLGYVLLIAFFTSLMILIDASSHTGLPAPRVERIAFYLDTCLRSAARTALAVLPCFVVGVLFLRLWSVPCSRWRVFDLGVTLGAAGIVGTIFALLVMPILVVILWSFGPHRVGPYLDSIGMTLMVIENLIIAGWLVLAVFPVTASQWRFAALLLIGAIVGARGYFIVPALNAFGEWIEPHVRGIAQLAA